MREKVTFSDNLPTAVILAGSGELQRNKAGDDEYRYFLAEERIMWVPPEVHGQIQQAGATDGDQLTITRHRAKRGDPPRWTVELHQDEPAHAYGNASPTRPAPTPAARPLSQPTPAARPAAAPPSSQAPAEVPLTATDRLAGALAAAIDAAAEASEYARRKGLALAWSAGDIRAMAATLYIEHSKGGRA